MLGRVARRPRILCLSQAQCFNFIRVLVSVNATHLYSCGTFAFSPACAFIVSPPAPSPCLPPTPRSSPALLEAAGLPDTRGSFLAPAPSLRAPFPSSPAPLVSRA